MAGVTEVRVGTFDPERFRDTLDFDRWAAFEAAIANARRMLDDRVVWNVNSTATGGGVAEMLRSLLAYARGAGIDARWLVIPGDARFFSVTKRLHNHLHGAAGDGGALGDAERATYEGAVTPSGREIAGMVSARDVVIVHDPQPAGIVPLLKETGATVLWRCHIGMDVPNETARNAWSFLRPYVTPADGYIFSRAAFVWEALADEKIHIVAPSIDAFSAKNQELDRATVESILAVSGVVACDGKTRPMFTRADGSEGTVTSRSLMIEERPVPPDAALVTQVSRWDRLKDPLGVMEGFRVGVAPRTAAHLVLAGPSVEAVADDPEGADVLRECEDHWRALPPEVRERIHLAGLPMEDGEENAAIVNALQRWSTIVVQKSLAEGFGLTVAEAMWKGRPVVASRIGGIQDQVIDGTTGVLVDPVDLPGYGEAVRALLEDRERAERIGAEARERVRDEFLGPRHLMQYVEIIGRLTD
ncbi:MAG: glycosyltransferase [Actinomycetota bacterium]|nr:glycosyltransferase [Actinomycetota bacterium]